MLNGIKIRITLWLIILIVFSGSVLGCTQSNAYRDRGIQLTRLPPQSRLDDVSRIIGAGPIRCEPVKSLPRVGIKPVNLVVTGMSPNSPASLAGIRPGDSIKSVSGQAVSSDQQMVATIKRYAREGEPLTIVTDRGEFVVVPKVLQKEEQCYWRVREGQPASAGDGSYVSQWIGESSGDEHWARFLGGLPEGLFLSACRISDGFVVGCWSRWGQ